MTTEMSKPQESGEKRLRLRQGIAGLKDALTRRRKKGEDHDDPFATIFNMIYGGAWHPVGIIGLDGILQYANGIACDLTGRDASQLIGRPFWETPWWTHSATEQDKLQEGLRRALEGESVQFETSHVAAAGRMHHMDFTLRVVRDTTGRSLCLVAEAWDITERKRAEEALLASETFLETIIENSPIAMWVSNEKGTLIRMNQACRDLLRVTDADLVGKYNVLQDNIVEQQGAMPLVKRVFEKGERVRFPLRYDSAQLRLPNESSKFRSLPPEKTAQLILDVTISPVLDPGGRVVHAIIQPLDVTKHTLDVEHIRKLTNEQRTVLNTIIMGISYIKKRKVQWANLSFARMFDYELDEVPGMDTSLFYSSQVDYLRVGEEGYDRISKGDLYATEAFMKKKDGTLIWCSITGQVVNPQDLEEGSIWVLHDITERKRAEASLQEKEERFKRLVQNSNDIIAVVDENDVTTSVHGPIETILGYQPEELIGVSALNFIHPEDLEETRNHLNGTLMSPGSSQRAEYRFRHKNGQWIALEAVGTNLLHDLVVRGVVLNIREVSERKHAEEERNKLQEQLQQAMKMEAVGRLAGGVAHDFNNLLTVITGYVELARMKLTPPDPLLKSLDGIQKASESAAALTKQLLAFSRRQIIEPKVLNLNDLVGGLVKMLTRLIGEDITLQTTLDDQLDSVKVDPGQFEQVLVNLSVNARDAMPNGGQLVIETANCELDEDYCARHPEARPGRFVLFAVSDTGHGMSDEVKRHLFEPFFTTKAKGQGTGLGLATIFGTVKQAGGAIEVYSEVGRGTTFKIYLPRVEGRAEPIIVDKPALELPRGNETILLVEDDEGVRGMALEILEHLGYTVMSAANGGEAFMLVEKCGGPIDLLMTDVVMPGMNGRELAERLLGLKPGMRVLFTSGYTENVIVHHGVVDENLNFIGKPYSLNALAKKIREVLDAEKNGL
jgi:two-component system, cell cycle sensor histidine kinase and response regulator CckA